MSKNVYEIKINWKEISKIISRRLKRPVAPMYCYSVYKNYHRCKEIKDQVVKILEKGKKDFHEPFEFPSL
jgi:hypothetical protein